VIQVIALLLSRSEQKSVVSVEMVCTDQACCDGGQDEWSQETGTSVTPARLHLCVVRVIRTPLGKTQAENFHYMGLFRNFCDMNDQISTAIKHQKKIIES